MDSTKAGFPVVSAEEGNGVWLHVEAEEDTTIRPSDPDWFQQIKAENPELFEDLPENSANRPERSQAPMTPASEKKRRAVAIERDTAETKIRLEVNLDGTGQAKLSTGIGFFDHMLTLLPTHRLIDLAIEA